ncbi:putative Zn-dependent protease [Naumannella cuiyingiana]|uniref:Putative Zn-dependent protease n=1 Tax=Naumannella cuiyingiana TaxID=1347891 RepID=A0A7Z0IMB0_9ACTN|nr:metallopeptidase TldD-related protein [Naumannella cuiyingiana]NYI72440.1 putative Zn-dependent protease [Naumannella cuiyingiana]
MTAAQWVEEALAGAEGDAVLIVEDIGQVNLRWANNALTTNGVLHESLATAHAFVSGTRGVAAGSASGPVGSAADCADLLGRARAAALAGAPADDATELVDGGRDADFAEPAPVTDAAALDGVPEALASAFARAAERDHLLFGFAELMVTTTWLGASTGTRRRHVQRSGRIEINAKQPDMIASAWTGRHVRDFADVDVAAMHQELIRRLGWSANRIDLPAGRYEAVLPPSAVADLMIYLSWSLSARDAAQGRNVFAAADGRTREGERLAALPVSLVSDPAYPGLQRAPFAIVHATSGAEQSIFDNGAPVGRVEWLRDGVLTALARDRALAAGEGAAAGPFAFPTENLIMDAGGSDDLEAMIARTERGLLLTCLWYIREVDPETLLLTGLTRDGVYLIESGEVVGMVNNFRFNESPVALLGRISEAGRAEPALPREWQDWFADAVAPPVRVPDFNFSTVSDAH